MEFPQGGIAINYDPQHPPVLYGSIAYMDSSEAVQGKVSLQWSAPFLLSKTRDDGGVYYYGTVYTILTELMQYVTRVSDFNKTIRDMIITNNIPVIKRGIFFTTPDTGFGRYVADQQDGMLETMLLAIAVNVRRLIEIFPTQRSIPVYDYAGVQRIQSISLRKISDLLIHSRYFAVYDGFLWDLFSDRKSLVQTRGHKAIGHKISLPEYVISIFDLVNSLTVNDIIGKLRCKLRNLSVETRAVDLIFVAQNLFSLASVLDRVEDDSLLQKFIGSLFETSSEQASAHSATSNQLQFQLKIDNLDTKHVVAQIVTDQEITECTINYVEFFEIVASRFGNRPLIGT